MAKKGILACKAPLTRKPVGIVVGNASNMDFFVPSPYRKSNYSLLERDRAVFSNTPMPRWRSASWFTDDVLRLVPFRES